MTTPLRTVSFTQLKDATREEFQYLHRLEIEYHAGLPRRILKALEELDGEGSIQGYQVSRLGHSLQTATRAERDGADIEMVVAALIHDIGDALGTANHSQLAASVIRPYVRKEVTWVIEMHGLFQMQYFAHLIDQDPTGHLAYQDHRWAASCQRFCERWDQPSFDPHYPTEPLSHFASRVEEVFSRRPFDPAFVER
ncbi:HD domain-containing protein [Roseateles violae]|uniref:HD domain-containing protein n=1 Tax=Roseateles violae TaxID=3058042 RepID=A0ABT8E001_9BURK|nr:HD domain-containing protein [Pelomonas sp. PFR6]MDN3923196.1 HD domain-containing protein [Pelomonas sp. PFR6]